MAAVSLNVPKDYPRSLNSSFGEWNSKILFECSAFKLADQAFLYFFSPLHQAWSLLASKYKTSKC